MLLGHTYEDGVARFEWSISGGLTLDYEFVREDLSSHEPLVVAHVHHGDGLLDVEDTDLSPGHTYSYSLFGHDLTTGQVVYSSDPIILAIPEEPPAVFALAIQLRSPGRRGDVLRFSSPTDEPTTLAVYDLRGSRILQVAATGAGWHDADARALRAGVYWVRLTHSGQAVTKKLVWLN